MDFIGNTFNETYTIYSNHYILKEGFRKHQTTCNESVGASKIRKLIEASKFQKRRPSESDFSLSITNTFYFAFRGRETTVMGVFAAIKHWNEEVNIPLNICSIEEVNRLAIKVLIRWYKIL